jgi:hypothetical protein
LPAHLSFQPSALSFQPFRDGYTILLEPVSSLPVSKVNVMALRYCLLLPIVHLAISLLVIYHEEALFWRYVPRIQLEEDFEKTAPPPISHARPMIEWIPCYEYRPSIADKFIALVEFPAGILFPPHGATGCNPTLLRPLLANLKNWMRLKTGIVLLDCLLIIGIAGQWWLLGGWIDRLRERRNPAIRRVVLVRIVLVASITISGSVAAAASFGSSRPWDLAANTILMITNLAWVLLLFVFAVTAVRWALRLSRKARTEHS